MATNFPTSIDSLTNPTSTDDTSTVDHAAQHANANDAIEALEAKVGADSSAVTTSHDYKLSGVTSTDKAASLTGTETLTNKTLEDGTALESSAAPTTDAMVANKKYVDDQLATSNELSELTDVTITGTPADNEVLAYDSGGAVWINQTATEASLQGVLAEGAFIDGDKTKLDNIEASADVTDTDNVTAAGALMDSELTSITDVKALNQSVSSTGTPTFAKVSLSDSSTQPPLNVTERATPPSSPSTGDIYLDDGTNTASTDPGWRRYNGSSWEDISASAGGSGATVLEVQVFT